MTVQGCGLAEAAAALGHVPWAVQHSGNDGRVIHAREAAVSSKISESSCKQSAEVNCRRERANGQRADLMKEHKKEAEGFLLRMGRTSESSLRSMVVCVY